MPDEAFERQLVDDLLEEAAAIGRLARDEKAFSTAFEAFRAGDPKTFQTVLKRARLFPRCRLVCDWICAKECTLLCFELCGPPPRQVESLEPRALAEAIVRVTTDERSASLLARAVEKRDAAAFRKLVRAHKLGPYCHHLCRWVCAVRCRRLCRLVCEPELVQLPELAVELQTAGHALRLLLGERRAFDAVVAAAEAGKETKVRAALEAAHLLPFCHLVCEWICAWRCVRHCHTLCRPFPFVTIENPLQEALELARATGRLAKDRPVLEQLSAAAARPDADRFAAIVRRLELHPYCHQLCHWLCYRRCRRFCRLVCPPRDTLPLFTHVGQYHVDPVYGDFAADGTTTAGGYAFTGTIPLVGILPDGTAAEAVEYRFRVGKHPGLAPQDVVGAMITPTRIGQLQYWYWHAPSLTWKVGSADYWVNNPGATATIPQLGPPLVVSVNTNVKAGGWIEVPRENDLSIGGAGRFVRSADGLANLDTTTLTNEVFDLRLPAPGVKAGDSVPAGKRSEKPTYRIWFEARKVIGGAAVGANDLAKIALSNTTYTYTRHTEWAGGDVTTRTVCSLDIAELIAPGATGCDELANHVHALYTAYHPYLGAVSTYLVGPGVPPPAAFAPAIASGEAASGPAGHDFDITALQPCAYVLWLDATVNLTGGYGLISGATTQDYIAFCKGS